MALGHEKLDVYQLAIAYVAWVFQRAENLSGIHRHARDQWLRASQSIPLNIAEGNGKVGDADRRRFFEIARGSTFECAAIQDVLVVGNAIEWEESQPQKDNLDRVAAMLSRLGGRGYSIEEEQAAYGDTHNADQGKDDGDFDGDTDSDTDLDVDGDTDTGREKETDF